MRTVHRDIVRPTVNVTAYVLDALSHEVIRVTAAHNLVVLVGRNVLRDAIYGETVIPYPTRFALGTGSTAVNAAQTQLVNEVWRDVFTTKTKSEAQVEIRYFLTSTTANGNTLNEAGLFSAASGGTMYARVVFSEPIVKTSSIAVLYVWTLTWSA
jgi:hypothetical protein